MKRIFVLLAFVFFGLLPSISYAQGQYPDAATEFAAYVEDERLGWAQMFNLPDNASWEVIEAAVPEETRITMALEPGLPADSTVAEIISYYHVLIVRRMAAERGLPRDTSLEEIFEHERWIRN